MSDELERQLYVKSLSGFIPDSEAARTFHRRVKVGSTIELKGSASRNIQHHKKFFAMLKIIFENQEHYASMDVLLGVCKLAVGHCDVIETPRGTVRLPKSISFSALSQSQFEDFYDRAVQWATTDVIAGLSKQHLDEAVEQELLRF